YGGVLKLNFHFNGFDIRYIGAAQHYSYRTNEEWGEGSELATGVISYLDPNGIRTFPDSLSLYGEEHFFTTNDINITSTATSAFRRPSASTSPNSPFRWAGWRSRARR